MRIAYINGEDRRGNWKRRIIYVYISQDKEVYFIFDLMGHFGVERQAITIWCLKLKSGISNFFFSFLGKIFLWVMIRKIHPLHYRYSLYICLISNEDISYYD